MTWLDLIAVHLDVVAAVTFALAVGKLTRSETRVLSACILAALLFPAPEVVVAVAVVSVVFRVLDLVRV